MLQISKTIWTRLRKVEINQSKNKKGYFKRTTKKQKPKVENQMNKLLASVMGD